MIPTESPLRNRPELHPAMRPAGNNIITIASGKGGVGKTVLAASLTQALANAGKKVLLFDGDVGLANVDIQLGVMPELDLTTVISGDLPLDRKSTRLNSSHVKISYAVFCLKKKKND